MRRSREGSSTRLHPSPRRSIMRAAVFVYMAQSLASPRDDSARGHPVCQPGGSERALRGGGPFRGLSDTRLRQHSHPAGGEYRPAPVEDGRLALPQRSGSVHGRNKSSNNCRGGRLRRMAPVTDIARTDAAPFTRTGFFHGRGPLRAPAIGSSAGFHSPLWRNPEPLFKAKCSGLTISEKSLRLHESPLSGPAFSKEGGSDLFVRRSC
jgi:hypothetical protein